MYAILTSEPPARRWPRYMSPVWSPFPSRPAVSVVVVDSKKRTQCLWTLYNEYFTCACTGCVKPENMKYLYDLKRLGLVNGLILVAVQRGSAKGRGKAAPVSLQISISIVLYPCPYYFVYRSSGHNRLMTI